MATNETAPALSAAATERFWAKVAKGSVGECWPWTGARHAKGYGRVVVGGRDMLAHVVAKYLDSGVWPAGRLTAHTCNNPVCCSPAHLEHRDAPRGGTPMAAKSVLSPPVLTQFMRDAIQELHDACDEPVEKLAADFNLTTGQVRAIVARSSDPLPPRPPTEREAEHRERYWTFEELTRADRDRIHALAANGCQVNDIAGEMSVEVWTVFRVLTRTQPTPGPEAEPVPYATMMPPVMGQAGRK